MTDDPAREAAQAYASQHPVAWPVDGSVTAATYTSSAVCMSCGGRIYSVNNPPHPNHWTHTGTGRTRCTTTDKGA